MVKGLELFSRQLENLPPRPGLHLTPIPVEGEADSLSAILLDNDYYQCIETGTEIINGIRVLKNEFLLLFKARAYLDLRKRKETDDSVKSDDIRKHRLDVFRISRLFSPEQKVALSAQGIESSPGFSISLKGLHKAVISLLYGDLIVRVSNETRPYEKIKGSTEILKRRWIQNVKKDVRH